MSYESVKAKPLGGKLWTKPMMFLAVIVTIGMFFLLKRFIYGLGSVSNMSDGYPWGIFIAFDVVVGTALACGGYSMALLVYILNKGEFHAAIKPALLTSVFGYTLAGVSVFFDVGRYWQMYNVFLPGFAHMHSALLEVAICIAMYIFVLWIEMSPTFWAYLKAKNLENIFNRLMFVFIAIGVLLPTLHQSSLGTVLVIAGAKVSPLWHTNFLPLLFLITAIAMGFSVVIWEKIISCVSFKMKIDTSMLSKLSAYIPPIIALYLMLRFGDLILNGKIAQAFQPNFKSFIFWLENILYIIGAGILWVRGNRNRPSRLFIAASLLLFAGAGYRFNAYLVGFDPGPGWHYFPSFSEMFISLGVIAIEIMAYIVLVKKLPILPMEKD